VLQGTHPTHTCRHSLLVYRRCSRVLTVPDEAVTDPFDNECFIISPIGDHGTPTRTHSDVVLQTILEPAASRLGFRTVRADHIDSPGNITGQIIEHVVRSKMMIADLTERNPNVFYELAIRHSFDRPVVLVARTGETLPFDIASERVVWLSTVDAADALRHHMRMIDDLERKMRAALIGASGSPIARYLHLPSVQVQSQTDTLPMVVDRLESVIENLRLSLDSTTVLDSLNQIGSDIRSLMQRDQQSNAAPDDRPPTGDQYRTYHAVASTISNSLSHGSVGALARPVLNVLSKTWSGIQIQLALYNSFGELLDREIYEPIAETEQLMPKIGIQHIRNATAVLLSKGSDLSSSICPEGVPTVAFMVSGSQLCDSGFLAVAQESLQALQMAGWHPVIDVPEGVISFSDPARVGVRSLQMAEISISISNFGTGTSSLSQLKELDCWRIVVDDSFVAGIESLETDEAIVSAIVQLGKALQIGTAASGVNTGGQLERLQSIGCDNVWGEAIGPLRQIEDLTEMGGR